MPALIGQLSPRQLVSLLRAEFQVPDTGLGAPAYNAPEGRLYWDITNNNFYVNNDGTNNWTLVGGAGLVVPHQLLDNPWHTDTATNAPLQGAMIGGDATPEWARIAHPGAAGYALVSGGAAFAWDQTPSWSGEHSFVDGIAFTGASDANEITVPDNTAIALELLDAGGLEYMRIVSLNAQPIIDFNNAAADIDFHVQASGVADAFQVRGADGQITLGVLTAGVVQSNAGGVLSSGAVPLVDLAGYAQGSIIRGGAADWEAHAAETDGAILIGDGADVASTVTPSIAGLVTLRAGALVQDDQTLIFGTGLDGTIEYDENGTDQVRVAGATWIYEPVVSFNAGIAFTGASGANIVTVPDNVAQALNVVDAGGIEYLRIGSLDAQPILFINPDGIDADFVLSSDTHGDALVVRGSDGRITLGVLGAGFVQSTAGGVLSSAPIAAGNLPAHNLLGAQHGDTVAQGPTRGSIIYGDATPDWNELVHPGAGYAFTTDANDVIWDQTPGWTGLHTFGAGWALSGGTADLNGLDLILDANGDSFLHASADDVVDLVLAGAGGEFGIWVNGAEDFNFTANAFNVLANSAIVMADDTTIGLIGGGHIEFDNQATDEINFLNCKVGINTSTPQALLQIGGTLGVWADNRLAIQNTGAPTTITIGEDANNRGWMYWNDASDQLNFSSRVGGVNFLDAIVIDSGNVGIGTTAPDGTLHVHTATAGAVAPSAAGDDLVVENSGSGGISILVPDASRANLLLGSLSDNVGALIQWGHNIGLMRVGTSKAGAELAFETAASSEAMRIDSSGLVGIGIISPSARLDVVESDAATNSITGIVEIEHNTSGAAAAGFGGSIDWRLEDSGGAVQTAAKMGVLWASPTAGAEMPLAFISMFPDGSEALLPFGVWAIDDLSTANRVVVPATIAVQSFFWARYTLVDTLGGTITSTTIGGLAPGNTYNLYSAGGNTYRLEVTGGGIVQVVKSVSADGSTAKLRLIIQYV